MKFLLVFLGGGLGSLLRYVLAKYINDLGNIVPYGTLVVNIVGSLLIGVFMGLALKNNGFTQNYSLFLITGVCGGFTTYSAFAYENMQLLKNGDTTAFIAYMLLTLILGIGAVFAGLLWVK